MESTFSQLNIMVVEDDRYTRRLIKDILEEMGFGRVIVADDGQKAIEQLQFAREVGLRIPSAQVDVVISDLIMTSVDGLRLLQWVRNFRESPNRFMPFIMLSGAADRDYVRAARDFGVNQFMAKPFSVDTLYRHLKTLVEDQRPYICTGTYFGPDRRRRTLDLPTGVAERRRETDHHVRKVFGGVPVDDRPDDVEQAWMFCLPNMLMGKMGLPQGFSMELSMSVLKRAEASLRRHASGFAEWAAKDLEVLAAELRTARAEELPERRRRHLDRISRRAHELRGQGGTFGYPLVTEIARSLYHFTHPDAHQDGSTLDIAAVHLAALKTVVRQNVRGRGGTVGEQILAAFQSAVDKARRRGEAEAGPDDGSSATTVVRPG